MFGAEGDIRFERIGKAGVITLTRPQALNAVSHAMVLAITRAADAWACDDSIALVIIKAEGRAFSAGGDIQAIYEAGRAGQPLFGFFADEYRLNAAIRLYPKPWVALVDGLVMGGGVGVSFHGSHRVMTEKAVFAMPETGIGFFPDVGASYFLSRLTGHMGMYLGLTGARLKAEAAAACGLASHVAVSAALPQLFATLCETGNTASLSELAIYDGVADESAAKIAHHYSAPALGEMFAGLQKSADTGDEWAAGQLAILAKRCPLSLAVAFRQISAGAVQTVQDCLKMEFRIVSRMLIGHDFYEGIRAAVIDKDGAPHWSHRSVQDVADTEADAYFAPLGQEELDL